MKKTEETENKCDFCNVTFKRQSTFLTHVCEQKRRWLEKDLHGNRIGFQAWLQFYKKNTMGTKNRTVAEFIKSPYYTAFIKFGNYCVSIHCINVSRFTDWLLAEQVRIDNWCSDTNYTKFIIGYLKVEDPLDAVARSIESTIKLAQIENIQSCDYLRYTNPNKVCYAISSGKISPWLLFQSDSGSKFLSTLNPDHVKMIFDYINPEQWAIKFKREPDNVALVRELLTHAGY